MNKFKTYNIITIGCQMNKSDSERIAGYFEEQGMREETDKYKADVVVLTTCGVRQSAEDRVYGFVPKIKKENPGCFLILTGCLSMRSDVKKRLGDLVDLWMPIGEISNIKYPARTQASSRARQISNKFQIPNFKQDNCSYLELKAKYSSAFSAFVPIGNGCNNYCSYCVVPYARGREKYRQAKDIIMEVKDLANKGYKEITLIAQNVNSYRDGRRQTTDDRKYGFSSLLIDVNKISGEFWLRFATSHPKDMSDELIETIAECERVCEHVHLPAQTGDNEILKKMNRKYTREDYLELTSKLRKKIKPPLAITTDIIVGFPGETKEQFENTVKLFKEVKFDMAYIAQYSPRPGTAAAKLKDNVPKQEKKRREAALIKILRKTALENNKKYIGKTVKVLVEKKGKDGDWFGKTRTFKNVKIDDRRQTTDDRNLSGKFVEVKIIKVKDFGMKGEIVD
ncbi:tRNA (N6-isopentenyl adenosine(37)-C2)-methylthiotransferase MiaB [Candidatus Parcubacteria bacterium]|nr:tRNA (N6-isopentenyl adenosine(37)-C2)-methylthiotransferase MiaB [Candidatus Parcubacteria bacterium]